MPPVSRIVRRLFFVPLPNGGAACSERHALTLAMYFRYTAAESQIWVIGVLESLAMQVRGKFFEALQAVFGFVLVLLTNSPFMHAWDTGLRCRCADWFGFRDRKAFLCMGFVAVPTSCSPTEKRGLGYVGMHVELFFEFG